MAEAGFIKDSNGTYKKTFYDLPLGEYEVKEENTAVPNYNLVTTGTNQSITEGKATITLNSTSVAVDLLDCNHNRGKHLGIHQRSESKWER